MNTLIILTSISDTNHPVSFNDLTVSSSVTNKFLLVFMINFVQKETEREAKKKETRICICLKKKKSRENQFNSH
jgi:hypothetical protein